MIKPIKYHRNRYFNYPSVGKLIDRYGGHWMMVLNQAGIDKKPYSRNDCINTIK